MPELPTLGQSQYNFNYSTFPGDVGTDYIGHYMVINISVPSSGGGVPSGSYGNQVTPLPGQYSKVDVLRYGNTPGSGGTTTSWFNSFGATIQDWASSLFGTPASQNTRIAESIALFMPQGLVWYQRHIWEDISMTELAGKIGVGIASIGNTGIGNWAARQIDSFTTPGGGWNQGAQALGIPINPAVEVMFSTTALRTFTFDWLFSPRNEAESVNLRTIIRQLKFHSSPEFFGSTGIFWIPPAQFDITIFNKGVENTQIMRIMTCVMEEIEVDYHPSGMWSAFRNGHPVQVRLRMTFREMEPIHKQRVLQGF